MDWSNVTVGEMVDAMREVEWNAPPKHPREFFQKFTQPKNMAKWKSRLKCNLYYYRTNYFIIICVTLGLAFAFRPLSLVIVALLLLAVLCQIDSFAQLVSDRATRAIRKIHPPTAAKLRAPQPAGRQNNPLKSKTVYICGFPRQQVVAVLGLASIVLEYFTSSLFVLLIGIFMGLALVLVHATFRSPNLKARLSSFREEFRAVWRGYSYEA